MIISYKTITYKDNFKICNDQVKRAIRDKKKEHFRTPSHKIGIKTIWF